MFLRGHYTGRILIARIITPPGPGMTIFSPNDKYGYITAERMKSRDMCSVPTVGEDEGGEDVERRLLGQPQKCRQDDLLRLLLDDFGDRARQGKTG
jgi:hypothetical protein